MTVLEATVEIVKATFGNDKSQSYLITDNKLRTDFLKGIEEVYEKLNKLEQINPDDLENF